MGIGPVPAIRNLLASTRTQVSDYDLFDVNEAFAPQFLAVAKELGLPLAQSNVCGGAIALGHPLRGVGARITANLLHELRVGAAASARSAAPASVAAKASPSPSKASDQGQGRGPHDPAKPPQTSSTTGTCTIRTRHCGQRSFRCSTKRCATDSNRHRSTIRALRTRFSLLLLDRIGVEYVDIALPGAGPRAVEDGLRLACEIRDRKLRIRPACAARTHLNDVRPIVEISQKAGIAIEVMTFIGSSPPIRQFAENWDKERILKMSAEAVSFAAQNNLPCTYVTEDTIRSRPEMLAPLFKNAIDSGRAQAVSVRYGRHAQHRRALTAWCASPGR